MNSGSIDEVVAEENRMIDGQAILKKRGVKYISDIVYNGWDLLRAQFGTAPEDVSDARYFFDQTKKAIMAVEEYCMPIGQRRLLGPIEILPVEIRLGWVNLKPEPKLSDPEGTAYTGYPTEEGVKMLNGYRAALGFRRTIQEKNAAIRRAMFDRKNGNALSAHKKLSKAF